MQEADALPPGDFIEYCKKLRDENQCEFYINTRKASRRPTLEAESNLNEIKALGPLHVGEVFGHCRKPKLCPYEMASMLAKDAKVIIADYNLLIQSMKVKFYCLQDKKPAVVFRMSECFYILHFQK